MNILYNILYNISIDISMCQWCTSEVSVKCWCIAHYTTLYIGLYTYSISHCIDQAQSWLELRFSWVSVEYQSSVNWVTTIILTNISVNMSRLPIRSMIHQVYHYGDCLKFWVLSLSYISLLLSLLAMISINVKGSLNQTPGHNHENIMYNTFPWKF